MVEFAILQSFPNRKYRNRLTQEISKGQKLLDKADMILRTCSNTDVAADVIGEWLTLWEDPFAER